ncbi:MAG: hypothetical protein V3T70_03670 [Phycisphaerae bacterium]
MTAELDIDAPKPEPVWRTDEVAFDSAEAAYDAEIPPEAYVSARTPGYEADETDADPEPTVRFDEPAVEPAQNIDASDTESAWRTNEIAFESIQTAYDAEIPPEAYASARSRDYEADETAADPEPAVRFDEPAVEPAQDIDASDTEPAWRTNEIAFESMQAANDAQNQADSLLIELAADDSADEAAYESGPMPKAEPPLDDFQDDAGDVAAERVMQPRDERLIGDAVAPELSDQAVGMAVMADRTDASSTRLLEYADEDDAREPVPFDRSFDEISFAAAAWDVPPMHDAYRAPAVMAWRIEQRSRTVWPLRDTEPADGRDDVDPRFAKNAPIQLPALESYSPLHVADSGRDSSDRAEPDPLWLPSFDLHDEIGEQAEFDRASRVEPEASSADSANAWRDATRDDAPPLEPAEPGFAMYDEPLDTIDFDAATALFVDGDEWSITNVGVDDSDSLDEDCDEDPPAWEYESDAYEAAEPADLLDTGALDLPGWGVSELDTASETSDLIRRPARVAPTRFVMQTVDRFAVWLVARPLEWRWPRRQAERAVESPLSQVFGRWPRDGHDRERAAAWDWMHSTFPTGNAEVDEFHAFGWTAH